MPQPDERGDMSASGATPEQVSAVKERLQEILSELDRLQLVIPALHVQMALDRFPVVKPHR